jgi:hypothetical protein
VKKEIRDKWLAALRSGEYKQTTSVLRRTISGEPKYCCLGVLCEVAGVPREDIDTRGISTYDFGEEGSFEGEPPADFLGLSAWQINQLTCKNDIDGLNFTAIADWIEANITVDEEVSNEERDS